MGITAYVDLRGIGRVPWGTPFFAKVASTIAARNTRMQTSTNNLMDENVVVNSVMTALKNAGWSIRNFATTKQTGVDITAERSSQRLYIEAKGITSSVATSTRYGLIHTSGQMFISRAAALLKASEMRCDYPEALVAIALPGHAGMRAQIARVQPVLEAARIGMLWVDSGETVSEWNLAVLAA